MSRLYQRELISYRSNGLEQRNLTSSTSSHRLPLAFAGNGGGGGSRPGLSFPLGTGLVVLIILFVSALFSVCYHWLSLKKARSSSSSSSSLPAAATTASANDSSLVAVLQPLPAADDTGKWKSETVKLDMVACPPVVYMAGEYIPRFIAVACPVVNPSSTNPSADESTTAAAARESLPCAPTLKIDIRH